MMKSLLYIFTILSQIVGAAVVTKASFDELNQNVIYLYVEAETQASENSYTSLFDDSALKQDFLVTVSAINESHACSGELQCTTKVKIVFTLTAKHSNINHIPSFTVLGEKTAPIAIQMPVKMKNQSQQASYNMTFNKVQPAMVKYAPPVQQQGDYTSVGYYKIWIYILVILVIILILAVGYLAYDIYNKSPESSLKTINELSDDLAKALQNGNAFLLKATLLHTLAQKYNYEVVEMSFLKNKVAPEVYDILIDLDDFIYQNKPVSDTYKAHIESTLKRLNYLS